MRRPYIASAAALWIAAGFGYLVLEAVAATSFQPEYSYADNYISDLGVTSPLAYLMNTAFYLQGISFLIGAALMVRGLNSRNAGLFLTFAAMNAVGNVLVGAFHSEPGEGTVWPHVIGAALAIAGGNLAILAGSAVVVNAGAAPWYRVASIGLAALGLLSLLMFVIGLTTVVTMVLPDGTWERGSVYSTIVWQMFTAAYLLLWTRRL